MQRLLKQGRQGAAAGMAPKTARGCWRRMGARRPRCPRAAANCWPAARRRGAPHAGAAPEAAGQRAWRASRWRRCTRRACWPSTRVSRRWRRSGLLRSLAGEAIDDTHDVQQLQRLWQQFDAADRRDAAVAARAALRAVALGSAADAREWLRPFWDRLGELERDDRERGAGAVRRRARHRHDWLPRLEPRSQAHGHEAAVVAAVGMAFADRQLWGKARKLLEQAPAPPLPLRVPPRRLACAGADGARSGDERARWTANAPPRRWTDAGGRRRGIVRASRGCSSVG
jgi:hypothetical protein